MQLDMENGQGEITFAADFHRNEFRLEKIASTVPKICDIYCRKLKIAMRQYLQLYAVIDRFSRRPQFQYHSKSIF